MTEKLLTFKKFAEMIKSDNKKNNIVWLTIKDKKIVSQLEKKLDIFKDMPNLRTLIINQDGYDNIKTLPPTIFAGLNHLTRLDFKSLWLNALPETIFQDLTELTSLSIEYNEFTSLPATLFKNNKKLKKLIIKNYTHTLGTLPENIFQGLDQLEELNLDANFLTSLPAGIFQGLPKLKDLNLNRNEFKTLPAGIFHGLTATIIPESLKELVEEEEDDEALEGDENTCYSVIDLYDKNIDKFLTKDPGNFILVFNGNKECESLANLRKQYFSKELNDYEGYYECSQSVIDWQNELDSNNNPRHTKLAFRKEDYHSEVEYVKVGSANHYIVKPDWFYDGPVPAPRMFKLISTGNKKRLLSKRIAKNYGTNVVSDVHCDPLDTFEIFKLKPVSPGRTVWRKSTKRRKAATTGRLRKTMNNRTKRRSLTAANDTTMAGGSRKKKRTSLKKRLKRN
jgi:Leucine-rich repeat (LRR) protein